MIGLSLSQGCYQRCEQRQVLTHAQKLQLKQLLLLEQKLKHAEFPYPVKGLEGMLIAHEVLQERGAVGVLIGGLAEAVWNQRRKPQDLENHKDVDVAVLDDHFQLDGKFERGVDWWIPQSGKITLRYEASVVEGVQKRWFVNGNGVVLSFGINKNMELKAGLYIPDSEWVVDMREYEAQSNVAFGRVSVEFDDDVFEKFRDKVKERVKTNLPKFVREAFSGYLLSSQYEEDWNTCNAVVLEEFDLATVVAINGSESTESP
ncbi:MAG: hypothetical protein WCT18_00710 [Patescibacteria group bacterium]